MKRRTFLTQAALTSAGVLLAAPLIAKQGLSDSTFSPAELAMLSDYRATLDQLDAPESLLADLGTIVARHPSGPEELGIRTACGQAFILRAGKNGTKIKAIQSLGR